MLTLKDFMEVVNYRITEGSAYQWNCYGVNAYGLDSWSGDHNGHSLSIVFDTRSQEVYEVNAYDYKNERAYRIINPDYKQAHADETNTRRLVDQAWERDDGTPVRYVDLEVDNDFIEKAQAIIAGESYDTRVQIEVNFTDDELLEYMKLAHQMDITFNELVEDAIRNAISEFERDPEGVKAKAERFKNERY